MAKKQNEYTNASVEAEARKACYSTPTHDSSYDFASDIPITTHAEDKLNRVSFAHKIAKTLMKRPPEESLVIGLYGKWGSGKSSVLNMMQEKVMEGYKVVISTF